MKKYYAVLMMIFMMQFSFAQTSLPIPRNIQKAFDKGTRSINGLPGKNYWQNHAAYNIAVNFQPATRIVSGTEEINYSNNSPDTLKIIVFKLYPNIYKKGSPRLMNIQSDDLTEGVKIEKILAPIIDPIAIDVTSSKLSFLIVFIYSLL